MLEYIPETIPGETKNAENLSVVGLYTNEES